MSALVRITSGIMPQHSRVGMSRAMAQFGEVIHCHKPPYSGILGEDFVNVRFSSQDAADRAYAALKAGQVFVDGFPVGVGAAPQALGTDAQFAIANGRAPPPRGNMHHNTGYGASYNRRTSPSPPRRYARGRQRSPPRNRRSPMRRSTPSPTRATANFPSRNDPKSVSPRRMAKDMNMSIRDRTRSRSRGRGDRMMLDRQPEFSGYSTMRSAKAERKARSLSPDPPGPARNSTLVKNPFYKPNRSPSREAIR